MIEMVRRFLRQRFGSPAMATALGVLALMTAAQAATDPEGALSTGFIALALIGAGVVSRDASSGALQMILARPIKRSAYLFGRYAGIIATFGVFQLVAAALALVIRLLVRGSLEPAVPEIARGIAAGLANALLLAAILLFFSTFLPGYADILAMLMGLGALALFPGIAAQLRLPTAARFGEQLRENILPRVDWSEVLRGRHTLGEPTGQFVLAVVVFLTLAALVFSRREFSYGRD